MRVQKFDPTLDEGGIYVVLCAWIALLEFFLRDEAARPKGRIHQHHIEASSYQIDQGNALCSIARKESSAYTRTTDGGLGKAPQRFNDAGFGLVEEAVIVMPERSKAPCLGTSSMPGRKSVVWRCFTNCSRARRSSAAMPSSTRSKLLKKYGFVPDKLVTDDLRSYAAAAGHLGIAKRHERGQWRNNRAENSHQPTRRRERKMQEESGFSPKISLNPRSRLQHFQRPTPSHLRKNAPSLQGHGDADVARRRRCGMSLTCQQICYVLYLVM